VNLYRTMTAELPRVVQGGRVFGLVTAVVTNNQDPDNRGRVKVKYPWLAANEESPWARVATPMAGGGRGWLVLPEVGDEVLVGFEHADMASPYVLGGLWSGIDAPPTAEGDGRDRKVFRSRTGHLIRLDDTSGSTKVEIVDKSGGNSIVIDSEGNRVTITADQDIVLTAPKGKIRLEAKELEVAVSATGKVEASGTLTLKGATVNIN
jgi:uncharacterized protein involved in type VI secretion and phage assembly